LLILRLERRLVAQGSKRAALPRTSAEIPCPTGLRSGTAVFLCVSQNSVDPEVDVAGRKLIVAEQNQVIEP
jgi:hypothetical protein